MDRHRARHGVFSLVVIHYGLVLHRAIPPDVVARAFSEATQTFELSGLCFVQKTRDPLAG
eukprot:515457-Lingulodinium_polyedra.AAC.1